jgi:hypothetical protein
MDAKEKKAVIKFKTLLGHNCCGDPIDIINGAKASLKRERLGKLVFRRNSNSKGELFYVSMARETVKIMELELTEEHLQMLREPGAFEIRDKA